MKIILFVIGVVFSLNAFSGDWSGEGKITAIYPSYSQNGILIQHDFRKNPDQCSSATWYVLKKEHQLFNEIYSLLVASLARRSNVNIHINGCGGHNNTYPVITLVIAK